MVLATAKKRGIVYEFTSEDSDMHLVDVEKRTRNTLTDLGYILHPELEERLKSLRKRGYSIMMRTR